MSVALVALLALANAGTAFAQTQTPWISKTVAQEYVDNLLSWYNSYATSDPHYALYHTVGYSFRVDVFEATPNNSTYTVFTFTPIQANDPQVVVQNVSFFETTGFSMENNDTLAAFHMIIGNTTFPILRAYSTLTTNVLTNTLSNSEAAGLYLYRSDKESIPPPDYYRITWDILTNIWAKIFYALTVFGLFLYFYREGVIPYFKPTPRTGKGKRGKRKGR